MSGEGIAGGRRAREVYAMKEPSGRRWLAGAVGLFLLLLVVWFAAAIRISASAAAPSSLMSSLRSRLSANYAPDPGGSTVHSLRLSIFEEVLQDLGMSSDEAASQSQEIQGQLQGPVPTATARDFQGAKPLTATPTETPIPTETPTPTATSTRTPRPTPTKTKTPKPAPTDTPVGSMDTTAPSICCMDLVPVVGPPLMSCTFQVDDMNVFDPAFTLGIADGDVWAKYNGPSTGGWQLVNIPRETGGWSGSDWDASYDGFVTINNASIGDAIDIMGKVTDLAGNTQYYSAGTYTMGVPCP
jgi:hypothetical protein